MKIFFIAGARPQFIKLAPLVEVLKDSYKAVIVHTGQHYDYAMSEQIFQDLGIPNPDIHLGIGSGSHARQTGMMMMALEEKMIEQKPDLVIIFGDTNSTLAGSLSAAKLHIPVVHIEAGLRSFNRNMPEEINRITSDHLSEYLFAPTPAAVVNLKKEGLEDNTFLSGDIMVDTLEKNLNIALEKSTVLEKYKLSEGEYSLLTLHRDYNVDNPEILRGILTQLNKLGEKILFPVHPRTKKMLQQIKLNTGNIQYIEPQGYLDFIVLENTAKRIITDSGGIQKEAYILQKPCITLRSETEWTETVDEGWNLLLDPGRTDLMQKISSFFVPALQQKVFGENVAIKMKSKLDEIFNG